jgi:hypothetical protein
MSANKTLLVCMSYRGGGEQVHWSFPYYQLSGFDILGTCPKDSAHGWPKGTLTVQNVGLEGWSNEKLVRRYVATLEMLTEPQYNAYTDFCVIEYDSIFLKAPPQHPGWLFTHYAGGKLNQGEGASRFFHFPHWMDRPALAVIIAHGNKLISDGQFELGSPDVFLGRIVDETGVPWTETDTFSVNGRMLDIPEYWQAALNAAKAGTWFLHGLKTKAQLKAILEATK